MTRKLVAGTSLVALCLGSFSPVIAQDYRFTGFDAPRGVTATVNLRVPLGPAAQRRRPSAGVTVGLGRPVGEIDQFGRRSVRQLEIADFRLAGLHSGRLRVAGIDQETDDDDVEGDEVGEGKKGTLLYIIVFALLAGFILTVTDGDSSSSTEDPSPPPPPPTGT